VEWDSALSVGSTVKLGFNSSDLRLFPGSEESEIIQYSSEAV
jgi:hypothetical protein